MAYLTLGYGIFVQCNGKKNKNPKDRLIFEQKYGRDTRVKTGRLTFFVPSNQSSDICNCHYFFLRTEKDHIFHQRTIVYSIIIIKHESEKNN